jgi:hypothetical protein
MAKKNRKDMDRRRAKASQKRQVKRKAKAAALRGQSGTQVRYRPGITEMDAPPGFRAVSMSQAILEFGKPLEQLAGSTGQRPDMNKVMQASMLLWNHALSDERGEAGEREKAEVAEALGETFGLKGDEAASLRTRMVERRSYLFPEGNQPKDRMSPFMFIRKERMVEIEPFAYDRLTFTAADIAPDSEDTALIDRIIKLDRFVTEEADYREYESPLMEVKDKAAELFERWLDDKGFPEEYDALARCLSIYLDFVYGYVHDDVVTLRSVRPGYLVEFFEDFLLRKMYAEPQEYVDWPPSIKLFYQFLKDKGYVEDPSPIIQAIERLEPRFLEVLRRHFG